MACAFKSNKSGMDEICQSAQSGPVCLRSFSYTFFHNKNENCTLRGMRCNDDGQQVLPEVWICWER